MRLGSHPCPFSCVKVEIGLSELKKTNKVKVLNPFFSRKYEDWPLDFVRAEGACGNPG